MISSQLRYKLRTFSAVGGLHETTLQSVETMSSQQHDRQYLWNRQLPFKGS